MSTSSFSTDLLSFDPEEISRLFDQVTAETHDAASSEEEVDMSSSQQEIITEVVPE